MNKPTIFLTFDDKYINEWHKCRGLFKDNDIRATLYVTNLEQFTPREWEQLHDLQDDGHTIGCHGFNHEKVYPFIKEYGFCQYIERELEPFLNMMKFRGFGDIKHFSYPNGNGNTFTDFMLLKFFKTLRYGGRDYINMDKIGDKRLFYALNFGKNTKDKYCGHEEAVKYAIDNKKGICLLMHRPLKHRLKWLCRIKKISGIRFEGMG